MNLNRLSCIVCLLLASTGMLHAIDMLTANGILYREFKIQGVNDSSLQIIHSEGMATVAFTNLPPDMQARWLPSETPVTLEPRKPEAVPRVETPREVDNHAGLEQLTTGPHTLQLNRYYHRFYMFQGRSQLFPEPLELAVVSGTRVYPGKKGKIPFQRETLNYLFRSSDTNVFTIDTVDRLILRGTGKASLLVLIDGIKTETSLDVVELPLRPGLSEEEVITAMGEPDAIREIEVKWPDDKRISHIRYKGYLPAEEWKGIPHRATHWSWHKVPGAIVSMAEDPSGKKRLYQVSSGPSMTKKALDPQKNP